MTVRTAATLGGAAAAALPASWLSPCARSSCPTRASMSSTGVVDPQEVAAVPLSSANAAAPTSTRRLLTVGEALGTATFCHPARAGPSGVDFHRRAGRLPFDAQRLAYR